MSGAPLSPRALRHSVVLDAADAWLSAGHMCDWAPMVGPDVVNEARVAEDAAARARRRVDTGPQAQRAQGRVQRERNPRTRNRWRQWVQLCV